MAITQPVVNSMLNNISEYLKSTTTSAQVLLGVMPSVLALLGPSHDEISMLSNIGRRPMLAMSLALACPSAYFRRAFEYAEPKEILSQSRNRHAQRRLTSKWTIGTIASVEDTFALLACLNVILNRIKSATGPSRRSRRIIPSFQVYGSVLAFSSTYSAASFSAFVSRGGEMFLLYAMRKQKAQCKQSYRNPHDPSRHLVNPFQIMPACFGTGFAKRIQDSATSEPPSSRPA